MGHCVRRKGMADEERRDPAALLALTPTVFHILLARAHGAEQAGSSGLWHGRRRVMNDVSVNRGGLFSERLYRLLLRAYPRAFREDYASEMLLVFRDAYATAMRRRGSWGVLGLWRDIAGDFITSVSI